MITQTANSPDSPRKSLGDRLTAWGLWRRRGGVDGHGPIVDVDDAQHVDRAVSRMTNPTHRVLLSRWFELGQHKSAIAREMRIPARALRMHYRRAKWALEHQLMIGSVRDER